MTRKYIPVIRKDCFCKNCGEKIIEKHNYNRKYCSNRCNYEFNREKIIKNNKKRYLEKIKPYKIYFKPTTIECKNCNGNFLKVFPQQVYCSKECQVDYFKKNYIYRGYLKLRFEIFKRDNFQCQYCGRTPKKDKCKLVLEHIIPKAKGGDNSPTNLLVSCEECNLGKMDVLLEDRQLNNQIIKNDTKNF